MMRLSAAVWCLLVLIGAHVQLDGQERKSITVATATAIQTWVVAVQSHEPGRTDTHVIALAGLPYEGREELNAGMALFLETLRTKKISRDAGNADAQRIMALARDAGDADVFLKRAAVLHGDVAANGDRVPVAERRPPATRDLRVVPGKGGTGLRPGAPLPPLLRTDRLGVGQDGQVMGETLASWNWPFARSLLDLLGGGKDAAKDPFVGAWYHANMAYMFARGLYGDATPHLADAARLLPNDARILFDRGCYAELLGLPMHQEMLSAADIVAQRSRVRGQDRGPQWRPPGSAPALNIPLAETTNADAERLYRRALAIDPSLHEARVRLARLLGLRGRHSDAATELKTALAGDPAGIVGFYAHLFAGRTAQEMAQRATALTHYKEAHSFFPNAQSALLALSQLALLDADVAAALEPVQRLGPSSDVFTADPWWQYYLCSGRDADHLLEQLWETLPR